MILPIDVVKKKEEDSMGCLEVGKLAFFSLRAAATRDTGLCWFNTLIHIFAHLLSTFDAFLRK
jgi:hypothetical protein